MDSLSDHLSKPSLLRKPLASQPSDRMPADLDGAQLPVDVSLTLRDNVGFVAEAE